LVQGLIGQILGLLVGVSEWSNGLARRQNYAGNRLTANALCMQSTIALCMNA
jgi:hypothetical protein